MTARELAQYLGVAGAQPGAVDAVRLRDVATPESAGPDELVFAQDAEALARALQSRAGAILAEASLQQGSEQDLDGRVIWLPHARLAFARAAERLLRTPQQTEIDMTAVISVAAVIGEGVRIGPGVVIEGDAVVGDRCRLEARVVVQDGTRLGTNVTVKAGTVLGSAGFGFVRDAATGEYVQFPQRGRLEIEDDVWIGANVTIDRGALGETRIGRGTKIDNLVHIAHNCTIGRDVVIAAQTGIAGSSTVGDGAVIAGQVGIADHVTIGPGVVLGAKAGVPSHKNLQGPGQVFWGIPARPIQQYLRELAGMKRAAERPGRS